MLKLKNTSINHLKITPAVKYILAVIFIGLFCSFNLKKHPIYISVIDIKYDAKQSNLQISARMFTNDLETTLRKTSKKEIDILNPKNKAEVDSILFNYITQRLNITVNSKKTKFTYIGYEKEDESTWAYLEIKKVPLPKKMTIDTKLLYDFSPTEINIVQVDIKSVKKSSKVSNPDSKVEFSF